MQCMACNAEVPVADLILQPGNFDYLPDGRITHTEHAYVCADCAKTIQANLERRMKEEIIYP
jgi:hypothetical protein